MTVRKTIDRFDQSASLTKFNLRMTRKWQKYIYIYFFPAGSYYPSPKIWYNPNLKHLTIKNCFKDSLLWFPQWVSWYHRPPTLLVVVFSPWIFWSLFIYEYDMILRWVSCTCWTFKSKAKVPTLNKPKHSYYSPDVGEPLHLRSLHNSIWRTDRAHHLDPHLHLLCLCRSPLLCGHPT